MFGTALSLAIAIMQMLSLTEATAVLPYEAMPRCLVRCHIKKISKVTFLNIMSVHKQYGSASDRSVLGLL